MLQMTELIVPVVGMGRSGTSAIAMALHRGGISMGDDHNFIPKPSLQNPKGFFENYEFRKINDHSLEKSGYAYKSLDPNIPCFVDTFVLRFKRKRLIKNYCSRLTAWGWKDPRTCLTLQFWLKSIEQLGFLGITKVVYIYRNPLSVIYSFDQVFGLEVSRGLELWHEHNRRVIENLRRFHVSAFVVNYGCIVEAPAGNLEKLNQFLEGNMRIINKDHTNKGMFCFI